MSDLKRASSRYLKKYRWCSLFKKWRLPLRATLGNQFKVRKRMHVYMIKVRLTGLHDNVFRWSVMKERCQMAGNNKRNLWRLKMRLGIR